MIPIDVKNLPRKPPAAAPIMAAGENTPPNKPKPMHNDVANNLSTKTTETKPKCISAIKNHINLSSTASQNLRNKNRDYTA